VCVVFHQDNHTDKPGRERAGPLDQKLVVEATHLICVAAFKGRDACNHQILLRSALTADLSAA